MSGKRWFAVVALLVAIAPVGYAHAAGSGAKSALVTLRQTSDSMAQTIPRGWTMLMETDPYHGGLPERGDVVMFKYPFEVGVDYIDRVIGLPGDHVIVQNAHVYINGHQLTEPYIAAPPDYTDNKTVPTGYLYVLGDNRQKSSDSHDWGLLPVTDIIGRVLAVTPHPAGMRLLNPPKFPGVS